jgi:hypothetical protein
MRLILSSARPQPRYGALPGTGSPSRSFRIVLQAAPPPRYTQVPRFFFIPTSHTECERRRPSSVKGKPRRHGAPLNFRRARHASAGKRDRQGMALRSGSHHETQRPEPWPQGENAESVPRLPAVRAARTASSAACSARRQQHRAALAHLCTLIPCCKPWTSRAASRRSRVTCTFRRNSLEAGWTERPRPRQQYFYARSIFCSAHAGCPRGAASGARTRLSLLRLSESFVLPLT